MRITVLASGSKGNATLVEAGATRLLLDAGIPDDLLLRQLARVGQDAPPTAVLLTHAHADHHGHVDALTKRWRLPVYCTESVRRAVHLHHAASVRVVSPRDAFRVGDLDVLPMPVPHDAPQIALRLTHDGAAAGFVTDLGEAPPGLHAHFAGCDVVLIESNHCTDMLWHGPYTPYLKRRIASSRGHLSNAQTATFLRGLHREARTVVLLHLSETNNRPELARATAAEALADHPATLLVATQFGVTQAETLPPRQPALF